MSFAVFIIGLLWLLVNVDDASGDQNHFTDADEKGREEFVYRNPMIQKLHKHSTSNENHYYKAILTDRNRCLLYPRCVLFGCCTSELTEHVELYFAHESSLHHFLCSFRKTCNFTIPFATRASKVFAYVATHNVTSELLASWLSILPPTSPKDYYELRSRKEFKILYMTQGKDRSKMD